MEILTNLSSRSSLGCAGLTVQFYDRDHPTLSQVDLSIEDKEAVLLLGPSGSGKTTLAQALSGIIPRSIEAMVSGQVWRPYRVGVLFQDPDSQFCMLNVEDEIAFSLENIQYEPRLMKQRIEQLLGQVGLHVPLSQSISSLSGGMKQRLALATVLALDPEALFFDEPTAQLDPQGTEDVLDLLRQFYGQKTMVMIEHKLDGVIDWMDRVVLLDPSGNVIADGQPDRILTQYDQEIRQYGIWRPQIWPATWEQIDSNPSHPIYQSMLEIEERSENSNRLNQPAIEVRDASLNFNKKSVWSDVNTTLFTGDWIAVMGGNGSGKSSFLRSLVRLNTLSSGSIDLFAKPLKDCSETEVSERVGFVFQNPEHQFISDTVYDEIAFGGRLAGWDENKIIGETERLLRDFRLEAVRNANPFTLSQGQKRRLSVAAILLNRQPVVMLDEPTFGQDEATAYELMNRLKNYHAQGTTILMATHDVELVQRYATRVVVFGDQLILYDGSVDRLFLDESLLKRASLKQPVAYQLRTRLQRAGTEPGLGVRHAF